MKLTDDWRLWAALVLFLAWWDLQSSIRAALFVAAWLLLARAIGSWMDRAAVERAVKRSAHDIEVNSRSGEDVPTS